MQVVASFWYLGSSWDGLCERLRAALCQTQFQTVWSIAHAIAKPINQFGGASMNIYVRKDRKRGRTEEKGTERNS